MAVRENTSSARRWLLLLALLAAPALAFAALPYAPDCALRSAVGLRCPGCGLGHALAAILEGRPIEALRHYPPLAVLLPAYGGLAVALATSALGRPLRQAALLGAASGIAAACGVVVNWLLRVMA